MADSGEISVRDCTLGSLLSDEPSSRLSRSVKELELAQCPVFILVGGLGTRLRTVYSEGPKVMAPVQGQPFLAYVLSYLARAGLREVVLCVGYRHQQIREWVGDGQGFGLDVSYSLEDEPLGTAGALRLACSRHRAVPRFFALNGDSLLQLDFNGMYQSHVSGDSTATVAVVEVDDTSRYGEVDIDADGRIQRFQEKSGEHSKGFINAGVYLLEREAVELIPAEGMVSLEREIFPLLLGKSVSAFQSKGHFIDIGVPADLARAEKELGPIA